ncbi:RmlD substrate binding domain protein [Acididesulfobacillus acetoxydans]|uniref:dTDP-4-dehydrorhamnose reductase n=1 Tax=Acididesulfobacillus acetoxydans TaxID=1561005 RepID=A0A8S0X3H7_9FIRM|nr:NAD(P)-dependent oxidoreductase [Acididesulfobacillus acetoxydans]CAA7600100.1 RmlD substrate binding domain protein [Acididesulfobacillus acetoxydans]CEJ07656.1 dTDP-4-dehydrorhamnose reductase [Acididesulfobacillus acetoxydans]
MKTLKVAVSGANGFLNSRLIHSYRSSYDMIPLNRKEVNITNAPEVSRVIRQIQPDLIIHGAAMTATAACEREPDLAYEVNVTSSVNLAKAAKEVNAELVFFSSEQVFNGNPEDGPYSEKGKAVPNTVYGKTKLEAEELLTKEIEDLWILRFSWLFGLPERNMPLGVNLFQNVLGAAVSGIPIKMPVNEFRGITYVYDIIDHFRELLELPFGTYHVGSENQQSTYETAIFILERLGLKKERISGIILPDDDKYREHKRDLRLSCDKIKEAGIPVTTSQNGIERALREFGYLKKR